MLIKLLHNAYSDAEQYKCVLIMNSDSTATMNFYQILDFKSINLLNLTMKLGNAEVINKHVSFRYKLIKHQLTESQAKLQELVNIVKMKNPSLIA